MLGDIPIFDRLFLKKYLSKIETKKGIKIDDFAIALAIVNLLGLLWANKLGGVSLGSNYYKSPLFFCGFFDGMDAGFLMCKYNL